MLSGVEDASFSPSASSPDLSSAAAALKVTLPPPLFLLQPAAAGPPEEDEAEMAMGGVTAQSPHFREAAPSARHLPCITGEAPPIISSSFFASTAFELLEVAAA